MQITARYTPQSIQEATNLNRHLWQRAIRLASSARALVYVIAGLWLGFALLARGLRATPIRLHDVATGVAVLLAVAALTAFASWRQTTAIKRSLLAQPDQHISFDSRGLTSTSPTGTSLFEPWSSFTTFHEGKAIVSLTRPGKTPARAIPTDTLTPTQTGELRSILLTHLPEKL